MIKTTIINRLFRSAEQNIYHRETWNRHRLTKMDITLYYLRKSTCFSDLLKVSSRIIFLMEGCDDVVDAAIAKRFSVDENLDLGIISLHWSLLQWRLCVGENDIWRVLLKTFFQHILFSSAYAWRRYHARLPSEWCLSTSSSTPDDGRRKRPQSHSSISSPLSSPWSSPLPPGWLSGDTASSGPTESRRYSVWRVQIFYHKVVTLFCDHFPWALFIHLFY